MRIAIINTLPVPSGAASVNRILSYSRGLVELGNNVYILSSSCPNNSGSINGICYFNYRKNNNVFGLIGALSRIIQNIWKNKYDTIIIVSNSLVLIYPIVLVCKLLGTKIVQEKSEFPFVLMKQGFINKLWAKFYVNTTYKLFDGIIVMTRPLMEYFSKKVRKNCRLIEIPMTVDINRFSIKKSDENNYGEYIAYCGNMAGNKDGVRNLIDAFDIASKQIPGVKLLLIGGSSNPTDLHNLKKHAEKKGNERIVFYGLASREEIPVLLGNAKALALARPSSLQSTGGFPTKLGEYLATSNPVIVTATGDIPRYLNKTNSFIAEPDDIEGFATQIVNLFKDYPSAIEIGKRGKAVADQYFNYRIQATKIDNYLHQFI